MVSSIGVDVDCRDFKIGEVYMMKFTGESGEQRGWRPGLIFQNNKGNRFSPNVIALPFTTAIKKMNQPTHIKISASKGGLQKDSVVLCENPERMSKSRIGKYITTLPDKDMESVATASLIATSAISFIQPDSLFKIWAKSIELNKLQ